MQKSCTGEKAIMLYFLLLFIVKYKEKSIMPVSPAHFNQIKYNNYQTNSLIEFVDTMSLAIPWIGCPYWKEFESNIFLCMRFKKFIVVTPCNTRQVKKTFWLKIYILMQDIIDHQYIGMVPSIRAGG